MSDPTQPFRFSAAQAHVLARVLDEIIPPSEDGRLPGAGEIDLAGPLAAALQKMPAIFDMIVQGLSALDEVATKRKSQGFATLSRQDQAELLNELAMTEHAFPPPLTLLTFSCYYQHDRVLEVLGLEARAPHPKGYEIPPNDLSLLDPVRRRPKLYRDC